MSAAGQPLSVPARTGVPRPMTDLEAATLRRVADALIPARGDIPAASAEPGFPERIALALDARSDAFESICAALGTLAPAAPDDLFARLRDLSVTEPESFQALSTVIAGAWLLTSGVRERIGYRGLRSDKAGLDEAIEDLDGLLDPVIERAAQSPSRWIRLPPRSLHDDRPWRPQQPAARPGRRAVRGRLRPAVPRVAARICHNPAGLRPAARPPPGRGRRARQGRVTAAGPAFVQDPGRVVGDLPCAGGQGGDSGRGGRRPGRAAQAHGRQRRRTRGGDGRQPRPGRRPHGCAARPEGAHPGPTGHGRRPGRCPARRGSARHRGRRYLRRGRDPVRRAGRRPARRRLGHIVGRIRRRAWLGHRRLRDDRGGDAVGAGRVREPAPDAGGGADRSRRVCRGDGTGLRSAGRAGRRRGAGAGGLPAGERARRAAGAAQRCPGFDHGGPELRNTVTDRVAGRAGRHREVRRGIG